MNSFFFIFLMSIKRYVHSISNSNSFSDKTPPQHVAIYPPSIFYSGGDSVFTCHDGALYTRGMDHMTQAGALSRTDLSPWYTRSGTGQRTTWSQSWIFNIVKYIQEKPRFYTTYRYYRKTVGCTQIYLLVICNKTSYHILYDLYLVISTRSVNGSLQGAVAAMYQPVIPIHVQLPQNACP